MIQRARMMFLVAAALAATTLPAHAQNATFGLTDVEAMLSTVFQSERSSFSGIGLRGHLTTPLLMDGFSVTPAIEYWRNSNKLDSFGIKTTQSDATLGVELRYTFAREGFQPYLGAGWGVHFLASKVTAPTLGLDESDTVTRGGLAVLGGLSMPITARLANVLELKFHYLPRDSQTKLNYGLSWKF